MFEGIFLMCDEWADLIGYFDSSVLKTDTSISSDFLFISITRIRFSQQPKKKNNSNDSRYDSCTHRETLVYLFDSERLLITVYIANEMNCFVTI